LSRFGVTRSPLFAALALLAALGPALAQSTNASPDISAGDAAFDPSKLAGLPDAAKQALASTGDEFKKGDVLGYVFVASPDLKDWSVNGVPKTTPIYSIADAARVALEGCEYAFGGPCIIFSINGHDTQKKLGGWASQPKMLFRAPGAFDPSVVPFVPAAVRPQTIAYRQAAGPRAFIVTTSGGWLWRSGASVGKAVATAEADCATTYKNATCILYAVNDRVVFEPN
jgi:hypothetical protein